MTNNSDFINSLVKIAEQMIDNADAPQKGSPEEVLSGIESIIQQLEQVAATIPAEPAQQPAAAAPSASSDQNQSPAQSAKIAELEKKVSHYAKILEAKQREEIASEIASFYSDTRKAQQVREEILNSKDSIEVLQAKLETISDYADKAGVAPSRTAKSETFSYVRTAKLDSGSHMHNL